MSHQSKGDAALKVRAAAGSERIIRGPRDSKYLQFRLRAMAGYQPAAVVGVLEYWLATPRGESDFDVRS